jgi:hypothetical protein
LAVSLTSSTAFQAVGYTNKARHTTEHATSLYVAGNSPPSDMMSRRSLVESIIMSTVLAPMVLLPLTAEARLEAVNRPDLLPNEKGLNVIQIEKFLTPGQARRMNDLLTSLERDTGFRLRVLCQNYPNTPGLAIRDYWSVAKEVRL